MLVLESLFNKEHQSNFIKDFEEHLRRAVFMRCYLLKIYVFKYVLSSRSENTEPVTGDTEPGEY